MGKRLIGSVGLADSGVPDDLLTTKGDMHGFSSANARIPIGDDDQVLTADSSEALGLKWATAGGGTVETDHATLTSPITSTDTSLADIALNITIGDITDGKSLITGTLTASRSTAGGTEYALADDSTGDDNTITATWVAFEATASDQKVAIPLSYVMPAIGSVITVQVKTGGGTLTIAGSSSDFTSQLMALNVG